MTAGKSYKDPDIIAFVTERLHFNNSEIERQSIEAGMRISRKQIRWIRNGKHLGKENPDDTHEALQEICHEEGIPISDVKHYRIKGKRYSVFVGNKKDGYNDIKEEFIQEMKSYAPKYNFIKRDKPKTGHLLVIDPADIHIGKLASILESGEKYNTDIAIQRVKEGVGELLKRGKLFGIEKILFITGNDILHIDTPRRTTTSGTPQDTDGMWYDNVRFAKKLYVELLEMMVTVADVHVMYNPSNHDYVLGSLLMDSVASWFHNCKQITFDTSMSHRKYVLYGCSLIGTTHGDGAKEQQLPDLMKTEAREHRAKCKYGYWYVHHIHHKDRNSFYGTKKVDIEKDYMDVMTIHTGYEHEPMHKVYVEYLRSPSGTDSRHHRNGYQHQPKAIEAYIHHPLHGQIVRLSHIF